MSSKVSTIYVGIISVLILTGAGVGIYFGVFYEKTPDTNIVLTLQGSSSTKNYTIA
ncbi:MAG: hypothetical protein H7646_08865, partial [Candidatus Heimdallarchaeota archaeon]|nr:hypothetical protein [Candidatus Heimdallarchaeota archaeon]